MATKDLIKRCQDELEPEHSGQEQFIKDMWAQAEAAYEDSLLPPGTARARKPVSIDWIQMEAVTG